MNRCVLQQSPTRLPNGPNSRRAGSGQERPEPARPARELLTANRREGYLTHYSQPDTERTLLTVRSSTKFYT